MSMRPLVLRLALAAAALAIVPLGAELALRVATGDRLLSIDPLLFVDGPVYRPGQHARFKTAEWDVSIDVNAQGFRDADRPPAPSRHGSAVVLGSSFVEGHGVSLADTLAKQLQAQLAGLGREQWVYNAGHHATKVARQVRVYLERFRAVPDLETVVLGLCVNQDIDLAPQRSYAPAPIPDPRWQASLAECSALYNLIGSRAKSSRLVRNAARRLGALHEEDLLRQVPYDPGVTRPQLEATLPIVRQLAGLVRADRRRFVVALFPMKEHVIDGFFEQLLAEFGTDRKRVDRFGAYENVRRELAAAGIETVDPLAAMRAAPDPAALFFRTDRHYSPAGYALIARLVARTMTPAAR